MLEDGEEKSRNLQKILKQKKSQSRGIDIELDIAILHRGSWYI